MVAEGVLRSRKHSRRAQKSGREKRTPKQGRGLQLSLPSSGWLNGKATAEGQAGNLPHSGTKERWFLVREERTGGCRLPLRCACLRWRVSHTRRLPFMLVSAKLASEPARKQLLRPQFGANHPSVFSREIFFPCLVY